MAKFIFWNTQRLGAGSGTEKGIVLESVLAQIFHDHDADAAFLCEVTSDTVLGDATFSKSIHYKKKGSLGYSGISAPDYDAVALERFPVPKFNEVFATTSHRKGGNEFTRQSKRMVVAAGNWGGVPIYLYHANASYRAAFVVSWVAAALHAEEEGDFLLVGDLNCEPSQFKSEIDVCAREIDPQFHKQFYRCYGGDTHNARTGLSKTYDWAIAGGEVDPGVEVTAIDLTASLRALNLIPKNGNPSSVLSDHLPILVTIE